MSEEQTRCLGERLAAALRPGDVLLLTGELGTGKTVLAKGVARGLGIEANISSPTYTLLKEYAGKIPLYHLDAYRLSGPGDLFDLGLEEYLQDGVLVVEWADRVRGFFDGPVLEIGLDFGGSESSRVILLCAAGDDWPERLEELKLRGDTDVCE
jgi:tRNA threonylcarbamoyladenosine biosynthesis protein TsaE